MFIAILMTLATYLQPIYWTLCLITEICNDAHDAEDKVAVGGVLLLLRSTPIAFYVVVVTLQRYHLFVWTVFSPKLLYEGMSLLVHCVMICIIFLLSIDEQNI
jgi:ethanolaminephosphotransferase